MFIDGQQVMVDYRVGTVRAPEWLHVAPGTLYVQFIDGQQPEQVDLMQVAPHFAHSTRVVHPGLNRTGSVMRNEAFPAEDGVVYVRLDATRTRPGAIVQLHEIDLEMLPEQRAAMPVTDWETLVDLAWKGADGDDEPQDFLETLTQHMTYVR